MMRKRKLILHIGMHKTGSSSLQLCLLKNKTTDFEFVSWDKFGNSSNIVKCNEWPYVLLPERLSKLLKPTTADVVVMSAEHLFFFSTRDEIAVLKHCLMEYFDDVQVYAYIRRQDKSALSFKQQASKGRSKGQMPSSALLGHSDSALPEITERVYEYFDYHKKILAWSDVFGKKNIHVNIYDRESLYNQDVVYDFYRWVGLSGDINLDFKVNDGVCRNLSLYNHKMLDLEFPPKMIDFIRKRITPDEEKIICSRSDAEKFVNHFKESNRKLFELDFFCDEFKVDFEEYPENSSYYMTSEENNHLLKSMVDFIDEG